MLCQGGTCGGGAVLAVSVEFFWEPGEHGRTMNGPSETRSSLDEMTGLIAERDALRRELGNLRAGLRVITHPTHRTRATPPSPTAADASPPVSTKENPTPRIDSTMTVALALRSLARSRLTADRTADASSR